MSHATQSPLPMDDPPLTVWINLKQAAYRNGFGKGLDQAHVDQGWYRLRSTTTPFQVHVAASGVNGPWLLAYTEPRIAADLLPGTAYLGPRPAQTGLMLNSLSDLAAALLQIYHLVTEALKPSAYQEFLDQTQSLPDTTEAERVAIVRTAQGIFRRHLDTYWNQACAITGMRDRELLRASHIKPWTASNDYERVDVYNGLLLSALWDAAFDQGLVSFSDDGHLLVSMKLSDRAIAVLTDGRPVTVPISAGHAPYLNDHRLRHGFAALDS
ncbi:restriction endonuclease [Methylobacterium sp. Leaf119]|nr:putative restriction endonuclease [Methylorubrum extorquens PA1]KQP85861.1 restriction endonuclease [Methylobacterium sp. Leaf119]WIU40074.1 HNH endonuclease [Methylorubrum extorquens]